MVTGHFCHDAKPPGIIDQSFILFLTVSSVTGSFGSRSVAETKNGS